MSAKIHAGSNLPQELKELPKHVEGSEKMLSGAREAALGAGQPGEATALALPFTSAAVNANSRVFVAVSEFNSDATINRFIGDARMAVYNVAPFNGGFNAWVEVSFDSPLNVRFDVLIDP